MVSVKRSPKTRAREISSSYRRRSVRTPGSTKTARSDTTTRSSSRAFGSALPAGRSGKSWPRDAVRMKWTRWRRRSDMRHLASLALLSVMIVAPELAFAQASPFMTGASSLQANIVAWLTPIAIILVMVLGGMAMANRISWGWTLGAIFGIAVAFGAPQIVTWVRGMFGV